MHYTELDPFNSTPDWWDKLSCWWPKSELVKGAVDDLCLLETSLLSNFFPFLPFKKIKNLTLLSRSFFKCIDILNYVLSAFLLLQRVHENSAKTDDSDGFRQRQHRKVESTPSFVKCTVEWANSSVQDQLYIVVQGTVLSFFFSEYLVSQLQRF